MANKILIVDDTETMRLTQQMMLQDDDYEIEMATNGVEALDKIRNNKPDLILMDIMMPLMDGIEALMEIRKNPAFSQIPVIALTAHAIRGDRERFLKLGFDTYISKPVKRKDLIDYLANLR